MEFDCDIEGDGDDGWEDDLEDDSDMSLEPQQAGGGEGEQEEDGSDEDMVGPGKQNKLHYRINTKNPARAWQPGVTRLWGFDGLVVDQE